MSNYRIIPRHDTKVNWETNNPILLKGEIGNVDDNPNLYKIGDGTSRWNDLPLRGYNGNIVNELGDNENAVMSQKAVSAKLCDLTAQYNDIYSDISNIYIKGLTFVIKQIGLGLGQPKDITIKKDGSVQYMYWLSKDANTYMPFYSVERYNKEKTEYYVIEEKINWGVLGTRDIQDCLLLVGNHMNDVFGILQNEYLLLKTTDAVDISNSYKLNSILRELYLKDSNIKDFIADSSCEINFYRGYKFNDNAYLTGMNIIFDGEYFSGSYKTFLVSDYAGDADACYKAAQDYKPSVLDINGTRAVIDWNKLSNLNETTLLNIRNVKFFKERVLSLTDNPQCGFVTKAEKTEVATELEKKFDKVSILQESGRAEDKVMSQKATVEAIKAETDRAKAAEEAIIYDVSAHNNGAVFESLQVLLSSSNLSTLIPTSVRHGGMSIRFIQGSEQSSDNKYVQYRLMSDSFNTTVANWQGVDDEPTSGSDNLVKSNGVEKTKAYKYIPTKKYNGVVYTGILYNDGEIYSVHKDFKTTDFIQLNRGQAILVYPGMILASDAIARYICVYDTNKVFVTSIQFFEEEHLYIAENNCYVRVSYNIENSNGIYYGDTKSLSLLVNDNDFINSISHAENITDVYGYGYYYNENTGERLNYDYACVFRPFRVDILSYLRINTTHTLHVCFWTANMQSFVSGAVISNSSDINIPENAYICIVSITDYTAAQINSVEILAHRKNNYKIDDLWINDLFPNAPIPPLDSSVILDGGYYNEIFDYEGKYTPVIHNNKVISSDTFSDTENFILFGYNDCELLRFAVLSILGSTIKYYTMNSSDGSGINNVYEDVSVSLPEGIQYKKALSVSFDENGIYVEYIENGSIIKHTVLGLEGHNKFIADINTLKPCTGFMASDYSKGKLYRYFDSFEDYKQSIQVTKNSKERVFLIVGDSYSDERENSQKKWAYFCKQYLGIYDNNWINVAYGGTGFTVGNSENKDFLSQIKEQEPLARKNDITDILVVGLLNDSKRYLSTDPIVQQTLIDAILAFDAYAKSTYINAKIHVIYLGNEIDYYGTIHRGYQFYNERLACRRIINQECTKLGWILHPGTEYAFAGSTDLFYEDGVHPSHFGARTLTGNDLTGKGHQACGRAIAMSLLGHSVQTYYENHDVPLTVNSSNGVTSCGLMTSEQINDKIYLNFTDSQGNAGVYIEGNITLDSTYKEICTMRDVYFNKPHIYSLLGKVTINGNSNIIPLTFKFDGFKIMAKTSSDETLSGITSIIINKSEFVESCDFVV